MQIVIVDKRGLTLANGTIMQGLGGPYNVSVVLKVRGKVVVTRCRPALPLC